MQHMNICIFVPLIIFNLFVLQVIRIKFKMNKITPFFTQTNKRSSMNVERLSSLAVLSVHSKRCDKIGADEVVDLFGNSGERRILLR